MDNLDVWPLSVGKEELRSAFTCNFTAYSSFNLFKNVCGRSWRLLQPIARKRDLFSMYRGALVKGFVKISVYFNKSANNFEPHDRFF